MAHDRNSLNDLTERGNTVLDLNKEAAAEGAQEAPVLFTISFGDVRANIYADGLAIESLALIGDGIRTFPGPLNDDHGKLVLDAAMGILPDILDRAERNARDHENRIENARATLMDAVRFGDDDEVDHAGDAIRDLADWLGGRGQEQDKTCTCGLNEVCSVCWPADTGARLDTGSAKTITAGDPPGTCRCGEAGRA